MIERIKGNKVVGVKQSIKTIKSGEAKVVYVAKDAENKVTEPVINLSEDNALEIIYVATMKDLGKMCGIEVGAAVAVVTKEQDACI